MKQSSLDVWEIRGLQAMLRMLGERATTGVPYKSSTVNCLHGYATQLANAVEIMKGNVGAETDPLTDLARMDRWFVTGFSNLMEYLNERMKDGGPMEEKYRREIENILKRGLSYVQSSTVPSSPGSDANLGWTELGGQPGATGRRAETGPGPGSEDRRNV